jgi:hypothetical protein
MELYYPKKFTDPEWKKEEKRIKVSATGIGKALRDLEKAVGAVNAQVKGKAVIPPKDFPKIQALYKASADAGGKALAAITGQKVTKGSEAEKYLGTFGGKMQGYHHALLRLEAAAHRGFFDNLETVNSLCRQSD